MKIAALQMQATAGDPGANLDRIARAAREAAAAGATLLVTPELAHTGYGAGPDVTRYAEAFDGDLATKLAQLSRETGIAIIMGFAERDGDTIYNSALFTDGERQAVYRKSHLYGDYERNLFVPGEPSNTIVEIDGMKLGILICYDVEFPENVRRLAEAGVDGIMVPTALPASDHAELIARKMIAVRAFENQIFVAYVDHCGADERFRYAGLSGFAAPDGSMLAEAPAEGEALLIADLDRRAYRASAEENTYLTDLRRVRERARAGRA
ncbi:MAG TPA: carbon-nitrogen hydrolase family protein [Rhizobiaceae bacterium]|nr:carbon-nitrogen hydrolase family protein [Rhizobiaceae bacterium]